MDPEFKQAFKQNGNLLIGYVVIFDLLPQYMCKILWLHAHIIAIQIELHI